MVSFVDTSATRLRVFGLFISTGCPSNSIFPSIEPLERMRLVKRRVSTPKRAGMLCSFSQSPSVLTEFQWEGSEE